MNKMIAFAAVVVLVGSASFANAAGRSAMNAYGALTPFDTQRGVVGGGRVSTARAAALEQCNTVAGHYSQTAWGIRQTQVYRACMARLGQSE
jgi:hypothetical protein